MVPFVLQWPTNDERNQVWNYRRAATIEHLHLIRIQQRRCKKLEGSPWPSVQEVTNTMNSNPLGTIVDGRCVVLVIAVAEISANTLLDILTEPPAIEYFKRNNRFYAALVRVWLFVTFENHTHRPLTNLFSKYLSPW